MAIALEGEAGVFERAMRHATVSEQARSRGGLAEGNRACGFSGDKRPRVVERREIQDVIVEGVGDPALLESALKKDHVHPHVLAGGNDLAVLRKHFNDLGEHLAHARSFRPECFVISKDRRGFLGDALGAGANSPLRFRGFYEAGIGHDDPDLSQVVNLDIETTKFTIQEREGKLRTQSIIRMRRRSRPPWAAANSPASLCTASAVVSA